MASLVLFGPVYTPWSDVGSFAPIEVPVIDGEEAAMWWSLELIHFPNSSYQ